MKIDIIRIESSPAYTLGAMRIDGKAFCCTLEEPWRDNQRIVSCIPAGKYKAQKINSARFGETLEIVNVPDRTGILIHAGNTTDDTSGCILIGQYWGKLKNNRAILNSGMTFKVFQSFLLFNSVADVEIVSV